MTTAATETEVRKSRRFTGNSVSLMFTKLAAFIVEDARRSFVTLILDPEGRLDELGMPTTWNGNLVYTERTPLEPKGDQLPLVPAQEP